MVQNSPNSPQNKACLVIGARAKGMEQVAEHISNQINSVLGTDQEEEEMNEPLHASRNNSGLASPSDGETVPRPAPAPPPPAPPPRPQARACRPASDLSPLADLRLPHKLHCLKVRMHRCRGASKGSPGV